MKHILVLCTGNSCRSVMAEVLLNDLGRGHIAAVSAGSKPAGFVHPKALDTLKRHGHNPGKPRSKSWDEFAEQTFDYVITVCDSAAAEPCPIKAGDHQKLHWSTPDPAQATGTPMDIDQAFERTYTLLRERMERELL